MAERPRSGKPLNKNWCRCWQGVCITQEVFADVTTDGFGKLQGEIIEDINTTKSFAQHTLCTSCKTPNLLPCGTKNLCKGPMRSCASHVSPDLAYTPCKTNGFCGEFVMKLRDNHRFVSPVWKNTDASKWCTDAWEIAKCFMSPDGYADKANARETDLNGLISSIMNCTYFQKYFSDDLSKPENIAERKTLGHTRKANMSTLTAISFVVFISTQVLGAAIDRSVSFSTGLTSTQYMMDDDTVVYDQVFINDFNGYNPNTGIFTCPIPGVYIFHFHGYSTNKDTVMWLDLKHNDQQVVSVSGYNSHTVGSNTVMLKLRKQDRIQVKSREKIQFALFGLPTQVYSTFTGYLVHEDPNSHQMDSGSAGGIVG